MEKNILYSVNISMEATIIMVLAVLLFTLFEQKKLWATTKSLISLTCCIIGTLLSQIAVWILLLLDVPVKYGATPMRIAYIIDYIFSYGLNAAFYCYVEALVIEGYKRLGVTYVPRKKVKIAIALWGIVSLLFYALCGLFNPILYRVENGEEIYSLAGYIFVHIIIKFAFFFALELLIRHKKVIGKVEATLSIVFLVLIFGFVIVDELFDVCIGHVLTALFIFNLFMQIDLKKGLLLERQEREITEWKTQIMLSQMQPHFIYNVLTTISGLCEMQNAIDARDVVNRFADYFRTNLDSLGKERIIPFEKELEHIKTYLWLEKVRFEDELNVCYEIGTMDFSVPSLTIQPIVENAVKHGIVPKENGGTITIRTKETQTAYVIEIEDNGVGFDPQIQINDTRTHVGIENVIKRLELICNGSLTIQSELGKGTIVTISIPKGEQA